MKPCIFKIKIQCQIVSESLKKLSSSLKGRFAHTVFFTVFSCDVKCLLNTRPFWGVYISFFLWCSLCKLVHWQMLCFLGPLTWTVCCVSWGLQWEGDGGSPQRLQKEGTDCSLVCIFSYCGCILLIVHHSLQTSTAVEPLIYWILQQLFWEKKKIISASICLIFFFVLFCDKLR